MSIQKFCWSRASAATRAHSMAVWSKHGYNDRRLFYETPASLDSIISPPASSFMQAGDRNWVAGVSPSAGRFPRIVWFADLQDHPAVR
jgi:hypothetical protein